MKWFTIKRDSQDQQVSPVTVASIREKLQNYQSSQGKSEFIGPSTSINDTFFIDLADGRRTDTNVMDFVKVEVSAENPMSVAMPFSIH